MSRPPTAKSGDKSQQFSQAERNVLISSSTRPPAPGQERAPLGAPTTAPRPLLAASTLTSPSQRGTNSDGGLHRQHCAPADPALPTPVLLPTQASRWPVDKAVSHGVLRREVLRTGHVQPLSASKLGQHGGTQCARRKQAGWSKSCVDWEVPGTVRNGAVPRLQSREAEGSSSIPVQTLCFRGWVTSGAGEPGLPRFGPLHTSHSPSSQSIRRLPRSPPDTLSFPVPSIFLPPPVLKTHQAPFLSAPERSSCPVRREGRAEGILGGSCLPARDLRNQTNKSPREHRDERTRFYISPSARNTATHLSSRLCEDQRGISSLAGRAGTVLLSLQAATKLRRSEGREGEEQGSAGRGTRPPELWLLAPIPKCLQNSDL